MPRDIFSNYTLPAGNPVVTGTIISTTWANTTLNDIATALTQSLSTDGSTAVVSLANKTMNGGTHVNSTYSGGVLTGNFNGPAIFGSITLNTSVWNSGTFGGTITNGATLNGGTYSGGTISGSTTLTGTVANSATVTGGTFSGIGLSGTISNVATINNGTYNNPAITGILTLTGGRIAFPATQVPSANANTLDDYEEGTWTPSISFPTLGNTAVVYSLRSATYTKIGDVCHVQCNIATSAFTHTTASGNLLVSGFPFAAATTAAGDQYCLAVGYMTGITSTGTQCGIMIPTLDNKAIFVTTNFSTGTGSILQASDAPSGVNKTIVLAGTYKAA